MRLLKYSFWVFVLLIGACQFYPAQPPVTLNILNDLNCSIPCWQGLNIGDSESVVKTFYENGFPDYKKLDVGLKHLYYGVQKGEYTAYASISNDRLIALFLISPNNFDFSIEKIIAKLGKPQYTFITFAASVETRDIYPYMVVYYPEEGYAFQFELPIKSRSNNQVEFCIEASSLPSRVYITKLGSIEDIVKTENSFVSSSMSAKQIADHVKNLAAWSGYKCNTIRAS